MQDGICPKCGTSEIYQRPIRPKPADARAPAHTLFSFLCRNCGYMETYMHREQAALVVTTSAWTRIPASSSSENGTPATGATIRLTRPVSALSTPANETLDLALDYLCPICGAETIIPDVRIRDTGQGAFGDLSAQVDQNPEALFFKEPVIQQFYARICGNCGYTALFVDHPDQLLKAYMQRFKTPKR